MQLIVSVHCLAKTHRIAQTMQSLRCNHLTCYCSFWRNGWLGILLTFLASDGCYLRRSGPSIVLQNPAHSCMAKSFHQINGCSTDFFSRMQNAAALRIVPRLVRACSNYRSFLHFLTIFQDVLHEYF